MTVSNERLEELVGMQVSPFCETKSATLNEWQEIAKELLALRKAVNIPQGWTMNHMADAALLMLDRIDTLHPEDGDRIEEVKLVIRSMAANIASKPDLPE